MGVDEVENTVNFVVVVDDDDDDDDDDRRDRFSILFRDGIGKTLWIIVW